MPDEPTIYEELDVPTLINGVGSKTRISGTLIRPEAADAMREAANAFARISDLQGQASELIRDITGAPAGYVATGAAAGLTLATAACIAGDDLAAMSRLPDTTGIADEVIIPKIHRNSYDHAVRAAGATLVEVGNNDRTLGPGSTDLEPWEVEDAIGENTVAAAYVARNDLSLDRFAEIAHDHDVPVMVDAAGQLPPKENLTRFIDRGADVVVFSGGKAIRGPQSTGVIAGREDIISSIALQHLDMDAVRETWTPPEQLFDLDDFDGVPRHGIGRGFKVGKEELVGLIRALQLFAEEDMEARHREWDERARAIGDSLAEYDGISVEYENENDGITTVVASINETRTGITAVELVRLLRQENPRVFVGDRDAASGTFTVNPLSLSDTDAKYVVERVRANLP